MQDIPSLTAQPAPSGRRSLLSYIGLGRTPLESLFKTFLDKLPADAHQPPPQDFDRAGTLAWVKSWIKAKYQTDIESLFNPADKKHIFVTYPASGEQGHYDLTPLFAPDGSIRIAIAGDWATGTDAAYQVTTSMAAGQPELTIHLGDIYYVGEKSEVEQNCLGVDGKYLGVQWNHGTKGSLALSGNHEMYSGGNGYFDHFLPTLGIPSTQDKQQLASYFCLETPTWRILGLDTSYNADALAGDCHLEPGLLTWLQTVVDPVNHPKPTILLTHHQWFSGFNDGSHNTPADELAPFLPAQEIVWLWGHEHRLVLYDKFTSPTSHLTAYGRCIGHGGMPIQMPNPIYPNAATHQKVEYWDGNLAAHPERFKTLSDGTLVGANGFAQMTIQNSTLILEYLDADRTLVLKETFTPNGAAAWDGTLTRTILSDPNILTKTGF